MTTTLVTDPATLIGQRVRVTRRIAPGFFKGATADERQWTFEGVLLRVTSPNTLTGLASLEIQGSGWLAFGTAAGYFEVCSIAAVPELDRS